MTMTVRDLIKVLLECDMDAEVSIVVSDSDDNFDTLSDLKITDHGSDVEIDEYTEDVALISWDKLSELYSELDKLRGLV